MLKYYLPKQVFFWGGGVGVSCHVLYYVSKVINRVSCSALWVYYFIWYSLWASLILLQAFTLSVAFYCVFGCICIRLQSFICSGLFHLKYTVEFCVLVANWVKKRNFLLLVWMWLVDHKQYLWTNIPVFSSSSCWLTFTPICLLHCCELPFIQVWRLYCSCLKFGLEQCENLSVPPLWSTGGFVWCFKQWQLVQLFIGKRLAFLNGVVS